MMVVSDQNAAAWNFVESCFD